MGQPYILHPLRVMGRCQGEKAQIVAVMHDLNFAAAYSDQLLAMADGQIVAHGPVRELMDGRLLTGVFGTPVQVMDVAGSPTALYCLGKACPPGLDCSQLPCCCEQPRVRVTLSGSAGR